MSNAVWGKITRMPYYSTSTHILQYVKQPSFIAVVTHNPLQGKWHHIDWAAEKEAQIMDALTGHKQLSTINTLL